MNLQNRMNDIMYSMWFPGLKIECLNFIIQMLCFPFSLSLEFHIHPIWVWDVFSSSATLERPVIGRSKPRFRSSLQKSNNLTLLN